MRSRTPALALAGVLALTGAAACSEQEQDEIQQQVEEGAETARDGAEDAGETIQEKVDENTGSGG
jgi:hypothetical protein